MLLLFLVIHLVLCLVLYLLIWLGALKCGKMAFMLVLLVPVWGAVCLVIQEIRARGKQQIREEVGIEKLKVNDEVHKSILMEEDPAEERVVPLEEALLINDPSLRRELMMEVMYSNPDDYVEHGNVEVLKKETCVDADSIVKRILASYVGLGQEGTDGA